MKTAKPKVRKPGLNWKWNARRKTWDPYHRVVWREAGRQKAKEIRLDWQGDYQKLDDLYWKARGGKHKRQKRLAQYTWRECIEAWRRDTFAGAAKVRASTAKSYRAPMDHIMAANGDLDMRKTTRQALKTALAPMHETPRKASRFAQTISLLWNYAVRELDWPLGTNPASGLAKYDPAREFEPWPTWMIAELERAPRNVRVAAKLILGTGQRPGAAIQMRWDQFDGEWMTVLDEKGDQKIEVFCPPSLRFSLNAVRRQGEHILPRNLRTPVGYDAVEKAFRKWRDSLGEKARPYTLHGLRKLAIVELAEAGCSDAEIQAVTGQSAVMVAFYRKQANRKRLSRKAQERRG